MKITAQQMKEVQLGFYKKDVDNLVEKVLEQCVHEAKKGNSYLYLGDTVSESVNLNVLKGAEKELEKLGYGCSLTKGKPTICW